MRADGIERDSARLLGVGYGQMAAAVLVSVLLFRLAALLFNRTDLFFDESQYWAWSREPAFGYYSKPPMIAWVIRAATWVCGDGEACVRAGSPLLHTLTGGVLYFLGRKLYGPAAGFWAAICYVTLPGVAYSAGLMSTDVPLLLCWAAALLALVALIERIESGRQALGPALALGLAVGFGLNAKYAMAYFILCAVLYLLATPARRHLLKDRRVLAAFTLGLLLIIPNILWNASNSFATFAHTADNANWRTGALLRPLKALEFFGSQFGVFGPVLFGTLLVIAWRAWRTKPPEADRLLMWFALPILSIVTTQALLSRAHANWAAPAFVAATVLVVGVMVREASWGWLKISLFVGGLVTLAIPAVLASADTIPLPRPNPLERVIGWKELANVTRASLEEARKEGRPFAAVLTNDRAVTATLLYYLRDENVPVKAWRAAQKPRDHFELTRPFRGGKGPVLLVSLSNEVGGIEKNFRSVKLLRSVATNAGLRQKRTIHLYLLDGHVAG
ncbi:MAG: phospholipid carrier-dependent glycosyltransferase [Hyphomicrobiaceae bacterium]|nr:MAG: phospholipid carrier-dependent glycosyltransferase [Hyphomicrobiaceae bacterium]